MAAARSTRLLRSHPAQLKRNPGITSGSLTGRSNVSVACEGGARFTGASDSSKLVSARSTGGAADPPKTPARRNRTNIRQCRFTARYSKCWKTTPADIGCQTGVRVSCWCFFPSLLMDLAPVQGNSLMEQPKREWLSRGHGRMVGETSPLHSEPTLVPDQVWSRIGGSNSIRSHQRIQPRRGMRYLGHAHEWKSEANATRETPYSCFPQSAWRQFAIRCCDLGSVSRCKPSGCWAMDGKADRLLRRFHRRKFHRRKSEPADGRESCRYHAIRRIGVGIWLGSAVARTGRPADVCRWSFEIWDALRR